ncbi:MAG: TPM domain-containing protein, partial [Bryobacteraceae bacterium]
MKPLARLAVCALALAPPAAAFDFTALKPEGYVSNFARVLDPASRQRLEQYCARLEKATGVQLALVTIPSLQGEPIEDVANALFRAWGVGSKRSNEGILLLLAIGDRRSRLEVGYGLEPVIPDG